MNQIAKQMSEIGEEMNDETYEFFIRGLRLAIARAGYTDKDFAAGIMNPVSLSKNLNGKYRMRDENISKCAKKLNIDPVDIVMMGKAGQNVRETPQQPANQDIPGVSAKHINPMDVLDSLSRAGESLSSAASAVSALVRQHQKLDERMRYWRSIFEYLPVSAMVIKDGVVISQNTRSRALKVVTGKPFCESCAGGDCDNRDICPVNIATVTAAPASGYKIIENELYKLDVEFVRHNDHEYLIVLATISSGDAVPFNRRGADRRKEKQEGVE